jgi:metal-responsive CopG/Arc/MetJ family transcriptional regulator
MAKTKKVTFTLDKETIKRFDEYAKTNAINKSALLDKLINEEIKKYEKQRKN